jgi:large subunit ribosomal protein L20
MARVKGALNRRTRSRKLFARAKGFHLARSKTRRQATEAVLKARSYAYTGRKQKKRQFRALWIQRLSAALMPHGLSYSRFIHGVHTAGIELNRKQLSELAIHDPAAFGAIVEQARAAIA